MKKMRVTTLLILLSIGFAVLAAIAAEATLQRQIATIRAQEKDAAVAVAKVVIPVHATITASMLQLISIPAGGVSPGAFSQLKPIIGEMATQPIYPGEQIIPNLLTDRLTSADFADRIPNGLVAIGVLYNPVYTVGGNIQAGDHVAVLSILNKGFNKTTLDASQIIAKNVLVMSVPAMPASSTANNQTSGQAINLAVTPEEANQIAFTAVYGQLYFVLEPSGGLLKQIPPTVTDKTIE